MMRRRGAHHLPRRVKQTDADHAALGPSRVRWRGDGQRLTERLLFLFTEVPADLPQYVGKVMDAPDVRMELVTLVAAMLANGTVASHLVADAGGNDRDVHGPNDVWRPDDLRWLEPRRLLLAPWLARAPATAVRLVVVEALAQVRLAPAWPMAWARRALLTRGAMPRWGWGGGAGGDPRCDRSA